MSELESQEEEKKMAFKQPVEIQTSQRLLPFSQHPWSFLSGFCCRKGLAEFERCMTGLQVGPQGAV